MLSKSYCWKAALAVAFAAAAWGGTFGKVVSIGGHASDLALDEARGVLYVANFTANRIEVMSLAKQHDPDLHQCRRPAQRSGAFSGRPVPGGRRTSETQAHRDLQPMR